MDTSRANEYKQQMQQEREARAERTKRIAQFIATEDSGIVADLFAEIKATLTDKEADELFFLTKYYQRVGAMLDEVENEMCGGCV